MGHRPDFNAGVQYWTATPSSVDGVLGGYGPTTSVPRLDAAASRMLILSILPALSTINPSHRSKAPPLKGPKRSYRALDCGAGIGRVTSTVLLPLFHRIDLVEPVEKFVTEAKRAADAGKDGWKLLAGTDEPKGVRMWVGGLQRFDPSVPGVAVVPGEGLADEGRATLFATVGNTHMDWPETTTAQLEDGYDLVMIQWCIGHLSDAELVAFLQRSQKALRTTAEGVVEGYIMLKENTCRDNAAEGAGTLFDQEDSSITRSDRVFKEIFVKAGLKLLRREVQMGFPKELFPVIAYVLR